MIKTQTISKVYKKKGDESIFALRDINFNVKKGEFVVVTGPSGSGKSTLLFTIAGLLQPTEGSVTIGDTSLYDISSSARSSFRLSNLGFVFQTFNLISYLNCLENVALPAMLCGKNRKQGFDQASQILERLGLKKRLTHRPSELSVGERQRVAICRSLINKPDVILADEPTGNLDGATASEVMKLLLDLNAQGQTIVMVTHTTKHANMGSRVVNLCNGQMQKTGNNQDGET